jgi:cytochrome d ubiquinol oxidase subunit I
VLPAFATYHVMIAIGVFFIVLTLAATFFRWRGTLFQKRWLLWTFVLCVLLAVAANELGWVAAETGRQPWAVCPGVKADPAGNFAFDKQGKLDYRLEEGLLTSKAVSEAVDSQQVIGSIVLFGVIYLLLLAVWVMVLNHKIHKGPEPALIAAGTSAADVRAVVSERVDHEASLSEAKDKNVD